MYRLFFTLFLMTLGVFTAFATGDEVHEPSSLKAQDGKVVYIPISPTVNLIDESKIQQEDQNTTGLGQAR